MPATALSQIGQIASMRRVHEAFQWLHLQEQQIMRWQIELVSIAAPPFAEQARAEWLVQRFRDLGLQDAHLDEAGNALALLPGNQEANPPDQALMDARQSRGLHVPPQASSPLVLLSAHIDTVFPAHTPIDPKLDNTRLLAPGACDNGAGVVALLALAAALTRSGIEPGSDILFAGNVGEEGDGDLRGMRHIYAHAPWRHRIAAHLVLDGAGHEVAVTGALGSRRFEVLVEGDGGHSWTDAGRPNPIAALSDAIATMNRLTRPLPGRRGEGIDLADEARLDGEGRLAPVRDQEKLVRDQEKLVRDQGKAVPPGTIPLLAWMPTSAPLQPARSAWNVGTIAGGSSVNAIPEQARARFDLRSTDAEQLMVLEVELHRAIEDAVQAANYAAESEGCKGHALRFAIETIGSRPAGTLPAGARILELLRGVDRHLHLRTECRTASTDANIPLSLGVEALSIGAGGDGGGIHTRGEWYDGRGRELGLRRILLLLLALATPDASALPG